jgi:hypothetical protein
VGDHAVRTVQRDTLVAARTHRFSLVADELTGPELHRHWGRALFNDTWRLMDMEDRTPDEDALMVHQAHASLYHWLKVGAPENAARGEWLVSRVYCVLGMPEGATFHAHRVLDICRQHGIADWDLAFAYEALARAYAVAGDADQARRWLDEANRASRDIAEEEDRELLLSDLETVPVGPER